MDDPAELSTAKRGRPSLVELAFDEHRKEITKLYHTENRKLSDVIQLMKTQHDFSATYASHADHLA